MDQDSEVRVDLLGDPWTDPPDPRGRKAHIRNAQVAETIAVLRAGGSTQQEIAARLHTDVKTLRKYYSRELNKAPELARQALLEAMWKKALSGNAAAANFVKAELERGEARKAAAELDARAGGERPVRAPKLGKKEEREDAARAVAEGGGKFAPPPAPRLVVSNP